MIMRFIALPLALILLVSCSTIKERTTVAPNCAKRDWYEIGRSHGARGLSLETLSSLQETCGTEFDQNLETMYLNGRNAGLVEYCDPQNGLSMGRLGVPYTYVCPTLQEAPFLEAYERGKKSRALEIESGKLNAKMDKDSPTLSK